MGTLSTFETLREPLARQFFDAYWQRSGFELTTAVAAAFHSGHLPRRQPDESSMRILRLSTPGILTHVISRFVDRKWMLTDAIDRNTYLEYFGKAMKRTDWRCVCYALMSNHLHFGFLPGVTPLESWAKRVHPPFAQWRNKRHEGLGPIFAGRPTEWSVGESPAMLIAYIHNNPVRAGVVERATESDWTSHRAYVGGTKAPHWLDVEAGLALCGFEGRPREFDAFVDAARDRRWDRPDLRAIREAARARGPIELGTPRVGATSEVPLLAPRGSFLRATADEVLHVVCDVHKIAHGEVCSRSNTDRAVRAKRTFIHAANQLGVTPSSAARCLGISAQAASLYLDSPVSAELRQAVDGVLRCLGFESFKS